MIDEKRLEYLRCLISTSNLKKNFDLEVNKETGKIIISNKKEKNIKYNRFEIMDI